MIPVSGTDAAPALDYSPEISQHYARRDHPDDRPVQPPDPRTPRTRKSTASPLPDRSKIGDSGGTPSECPPVFPLPPSASVHTLETNGKFLDGEDLTHAGRSDSRYTAPHANQREQAFRHSSWKVVRAKVFASLRRLHKSDTRMDRFANCGARLHAKKHVQTGDIKLTCWQCKDRMCQPCQRARANRIRAALAPLIDASCQRFLTLTRKASNRPLSAQITELYAAFRKLRASKSWKSHVTGGACFLEVKISGRSKLWHPHLHILIEGSYYPQAEISSAWYRATGDSTIVFVEQIGNEGKLVCELSKYLTKPGDASLYHVPAKLDEYITAISGRRACMTFGSWRGTVLEPMSEKDANWEDQPSFPELMNSAAMRDTDAIALIQRLLAKYPKLHPLLSIPPPDSPVILPF